MALFSPCSQFRLENEPDCKETVLRGRKILVHVTIHNYSYINIYDSSHVASVKVAAAALLPAGAAHAYQFTQIRFQSLPSHPTY